MTHHIPLYNSPPEVEFYSRYFNTQVGDCENIGMDGIARDAQFDIYVITFNNPFLVEYQIKTLRRFFRPDFNLIIVDNNNWLHPESSRVIYDICLKEEVLYLKAPDNYYQHPESFDPSMKLGTTMNWLFHNVIKRRQLKYFGMMDHDCFLFKDIDLRSYLNEKNMYGTVCRTSKSDAWNLHVTANFFRFDFVKNLPLDFRASHKHTLDTGGANYELLYRDRNINDYVLDHHGHRYADHDVNRKDSVQHYEIIDNCWFHMAASSHDQLAGDGAYKLAYAKGFLDSRLLLHR